MTQQLPSGTFLPLNNFKNTETIERSRRILEGARKIIHSLGNGIVLKNSLLNRLSVFCRIAVSFLNFVTFVTLTVITNVQPTLSVLN